MADVTKDDIKELLDKKIDPFARSVQQEFDSVRQEMNEGFNEVNQRLNSVEEDVKWMKKNSGELFSKLDDFITLYKDQKEEMNALAKQVRRLEERVSQLEA